jgi:hypothetical protein
MLKRSVAVLLLLPGLAAPAGADPVLDQIEQAKQYYGKSDYSAAVTELQFAINEIQSKLNELYAQTFPAPPQGWTAAPPQVEAGSALLGGGSTLSRSYSPEEGEGSIQAQLMVDNPMIQGLAAVFNNAALMSADPNVKRVRIGRESALLRWDEESKAGEITLVLGGRILAKLDGQGLASPEPLAEMMKAWDLDKLKKLGGI